MILSITWIILCHIRYIILICFRKMFGMYVTIALHKYEPDWTEMMTMNRNQHIYLHKYTLSLELTWSDFVILNTYLYFPIWPVTRPCFVRFRKFLYSFSFSTSLRRFCKEFWTFGVGPIFKKSFLKSDKDVCCSFTFLGAKDFCW